jgi:hypothetical protein
MNERGRRPEFWMPRANPARGKVRSASMPAHSRRLERHDYPEAQAMWCFSGAQTTKITWRAHSCVALEQPRQSDGLFEWPD